MALLKPLMDSQTLNWYFLGMCIDRYQAVGKIFHFQLCPEPIIKSQRILLATHPCPIATVLLPMG